MSLKNKFVLVILCLLAGKARAQQATNGDVNQNYYNINLPKTPEAAGIEQFGKTPVNELTGTPDISIPIYTLKSNFLSVPITISYHPAGIKVNQEASWVGLGWDLVAGGSITVETKGDIDKWPVTGGTTIPGPSTRAVGIDSIFSRLKNSNSLGVLTYATPWLDWPWPATSANCPSCYFPYNVPDDFYTVSDLVQLGSGEPDIFHANFLGQSFSFFFDKVTGALTFKGEKSTFNVMPTLNSNGYIDHFTITDNDGVIYYFTQPESTTITLPSNATQIPTTTSAWLLTRIVHPSLDYIQFNYASYGNSYPMMTPSGYMNIQMGGVNGGGLSTLNKTQPGYGQSQTLHTPYYLASIQSPDVEVDFSLGSRNDLYGPGSKALNKISIKERQTGNIWKTANFNYSYFTAAQNSNLTDFASYMSLTGISTSDYLACHNLRLRLDQLTINNLPPYQFSYNPITVDKLSYSQDHFGYYNGASNNSQGANPLSLIPTTGAGAAIGISSFDGVADRSCNSTSMLAMSLQSIVYPTGGSSSFVFEPHQSMGISFSGSGGGLRIKTINNYAAPGTLTNSINYTYGQGTFYGNVNYLATYYKMGSTTTGAMGNPGPNAWQYNLSSNGFSNDNDLTIAYTTVTIEQKGPAGESNGKTVKVFNVPFPYGNDGAGHELRSPAWPTNPPNVIDDHFLNISKVAFAPSIPGNLDGKLQQEQYFDNSGNLLKSISYNYHQANYSENFYDIRAVDMVIGGFGTSTSFFEAENSVRGAMIYVSPNKTYKTLTDKVVETNYLNGTPLVTEKDYTYNSLYQVQTETVFRSDHTSTTTAYQYPIDLIGSGATLIYQMKGANVLSPVLNATVTRNGAPVSYVNTNYYKPFNNVNVFVPQSTQVQVGGNPVETRFLYNSYDNQGHLLERQLVNGVKEDFLWGYGQRFPVAKVVGSDYATVQGIVDASVLFSPISDGALRTELNKLRTGLPQALVTTYTYNVFTGVTSETDPAGRITSFFYDPIGRLSYTQDHEGKIINRYCYNYNGQSTSCQVLVAYPVVASNSTNRIVHLTFAATDGSNTINMDVAPGAVNQTIGTVRQGAYTVTMNPDNPVNTYPIIFNSGGFTQRYFSLVSFGGVQVSGAYSVNVSTPTYYPVVMTNNTSQVANVTFADASGTQWTFSGASAITNQTIGSIPDGTYTVTVNPTAVSTSYPVIYAYNGAQQRATTSVSYSSQAISASTSISVSPPAACPVIASNSTTEPMIFTFSDAYSSNSPSFSVPAGANNQNVGSIPQSTYNVTMQPNPGANTYPVVYSYGGSMQTDYRTVTFSNQQVWGLVSPSVRPVASGSIYLANTTNQTVSAKLTNSYGGIFGPYAQSPGVSGTLATIPQGSYTILLSNSNPVSTYPIVFTVPGNSQEWYGPVAFGGCAITGQFVTGAAPAPAEPIIASNNTAKSVTLKFTDNNSGAVFTLTVAAGVSNQQVGTVPLGTYDVLMTPSSSIASQPILWQLGNASQTYYGPVAFGGAVINGSTTISIIKEY